jgi:hypothetical protein
MLPDVERGGASSATKFEHGSWIDAEPRSAVLTFPRGLDRLSLPGSFNAWGEAWASASTFEPGRSTARLS